METEILSKKDARFQFKKLGIWVKENAITVGRFFIIKEPNDVSVKTSPFGVVGNSVDGVGVSFVYYFYGILTDNKMLNYVLSRFNFLVPKMWKREYAVYVRAFGGRNSRFPSVVLKRNSALVNYDLHGHSFMASGEEWLVKDKRLIKADRLKPLSTSPI